MLFEGAGVQEAWVAAHACNVLALVVGDRRRTRTPRLSSTAHKFKASMGYLRLSEKKMFLVCLKITTRKTEQNN